MFRKLSISMVLLGLIGLSATAQDAVVRISSQKALSSVRAAIDKQVKAGNKQVTVVIAPGNYEFGEYHLTLKNLDYHDVDLKITGEGVTLSGSGETIRKGADMPRLNRYYCYLAEDGSELDAWSDFMLSDRDVEVLNRNSGECRIHCTNKLKDCNAEACAGQYILITQSFKSGRYKVTSIRKNYIYFTTDDVASINYDSSVGKRCPRFKLLGNADIPGKVDAAKYGPVKVCKTCNFLYVENCRFKSLVVEGLAFKGNKESAQLITITGTKAQNGISIRNCDFSNIHSDIIMLKDTDDVTIEGNSFTDAYRVCVKSDNRSARTEVRGNKFCHCGTGVQNTACVTCSGTDFHICDNEFKDFGYSAVSVGLHYTSKRFEQIGGIVERNEIFYTEDYAKDAFGNFLMDSGAIYLMTNHDNTVIRNNFIHDINGYYSNNGIYCDDGAKGFSLVGNIIIGIANGYTIYSRRVAHVETDSKSQVRKTNVDNVIKDNIIDGKYMFVGRSGANNCVKGRNYLIKGADGSVPVLKSSDIPVSEKDVILENVSVEDGVLQVGGKAIRQYFSSDNFKPVQKYLK